MIRNLIEVVFWCATLAVMVGLYMNAVTTVETEMIASQDVAKQVVLSE